MSDDDRTGTAGQRWRHRTDGYVVGLEGWIPGARTWTATRQATGATELIRDCDLSALFVLVAGSSEGR